MTSEADLLSIDANYTHIAYDLWVFFFVFWFCVCWWICKHSGEWIIGIMHLNHQVIELENYLILLEDGNDQQERDKLKRKTNPVPKMSIYFETLFD